ncbi:hypothetical protein Tco_1482371 [Tanacetum coccineum]
MHMKRFAGLLNSGSSLDSIMSHLLPIAKRKSSKSTIGKLVVAAVAYFIWQERNRRLFKKSKRVAKEVIGCIMASVRLKLLSFHSRSLEIELCLLTFGSSLPLVLSSSHMACHMIFGCSSMLLEVNVTFQSHSIVLN